jgi:predicted ribosome quality control (RQC) complex YloA/Tae2 family protein
MRLELDPDLEKLLDQIRKENQYYISGKGHSDTVRFLAHYYRDHKAIVETLQNAFQDVQGTIERCIKEAFVEVIRKALGV